MKLIYRISLEFQVFRIKPKMQHGKHNLIQQGNSLIFSRFSGNNGHINQRLQYLLHKDKLITYGLHLPHLYLMSPYCNDDLS